MHANRVPRSLLVRGNSKSKKHKGAAAGFAVLSAWETACSVLARVLQNRGAPRFEGHCAGHKSDSYS